MVTLLRGGVLYSGRIDVSLRTTHSRTEYTLQYCIGRRAARDYRRKRNWLVMGQISERSGILFSREGLSDVSIRNGTVHCEGQDI